MIYKVKKHMYNLAFSNMHITSNTILQNCC